MMDKRDLEADWKYCQEILPKVSRTFALNIGQLEGDINRTVLLGYLLFRIADTFEDTVHQDEGEKITALRDFSDIFRGARASVKGSPCMNPSSFDGGRTATPRALLKMATGPYGVTSISRKATDVNNGVTS